MGSLKIFPLTMCFSTAVLAAPVPAVPVSPPPTAPAIFTTVTSLTRGAFSGLDFYYFSKEDRLNTVQELIRAIQADYASLEIKKERIKLDFDAIAKSALDAESAIADLPNGNPSGQAAANLAFFDRMKFFIAEFQDTHFSIRATGLLTPVVLGLSFTKIEGKYYVSGVSDRLMAYSSKISGDAGFGGIQVGDELTSIDGDTPDQAVAKMTPYISGSSEAYRVNSAVVGLSMRSSLLPVKPFAIVTLNDISGKPTTYKMPWFYKSGNRADQMRYLSERGFTKYDDLQLTWDDVTKQWTNTDLSWAIYRMGYSLKGLTDAKVYVDVDTPSSVVLRTGYVLRDGKSYGVMQVFGFMASKVTADGRSSTDFNDTMRAFLDELKAAGAPLILDLRSNNGGKLDNPSTLLSLLAKEKTTYPGPTLTMAVTRFMRQLPLTFQQDPSTPKVFRNSLMADTIPTLMATAVANGDTYVAPFSFGDIGTDAQVGGFDGKIVALISPNCISACDMMSILLKSSGRATLIGEPANGTGAGFMSDDQLSPDWSDTYKTLTTKIPNFLFGKPGGDAGVMVFDKSRVSELNTENKPTQPDVEYHTNLVDLLAGEAGWIAKAVETLESP